MSTPAMSHGRCEGAFAAGRAEALGFPDCRALTFILMQTPDPIHGSTSVYQYAAAALGLHVAEFGS
jgi:hypothetical protein